jgi:hypothetical protein
MKIPGYDQAPPAMASGQGGGDQGDQGQQQQGDGLHHHEIHEDEGGGFHSVHTFPDGRVDAQDHVDYKDAKDKQDADFGCGSQDDAGDGEDGADDGDSSFADDGEGEDMSTDNVAKSYGNKARQ